MSFSRIFLVFGLFLLLFQASYAKADNTLLPDPLGQQSADDYLEPHDTDSGKLPSGTGVTAPQTGGHTPAPELEQAGERALISGVPRYYQPGLSIWGACEGDEFPAGCGPVAGAAIAGWWERRGFSGLMTGGQNADGLPYDTIFELGRGRYMDRITGCDQTAVLPDKFKSGLQTYLNERSDIDFTVTKYTIEENSDFESLWSMVKSEIRAGRPLVYLFRADGDNIYSGYDFANHYAVVVGFDEQYGKKILIVQGNWGDGNWSTGYMNTYANDESYGNNDYLELGHFARPEAAINYNLFTIRPEEEPDYSGECSDWLLITTRFHSPNPNDGVNSEYFEPETFYMRDQPEWGRTSSISLQDDICFVAEWHDYDADGTYDDVDNCPGLANNQSDSDNDGVGDACDFPNLQLSMRYGKTPYIRTDLGGNRSRLSFNLYTTLRNNGTDPVPAGSVLRIRWAQEAVEFGGGDASAAATVSVAQSKNASGRLVYGVNKSSGIIAMPYNPFESSSQTITLSSDFMPNSSVSLDDQRFYVTVDEGDCILVTHTADVNDTLEEELDENNLVALEGYDTLSDCYGVLDVDYSAIISGIVGQEPATGPQNELEPDIVKAGLAQVIDIIRDVGPNGGLIDIGPLVLDIPEGAFSQTMPIRISKASQQPPMNSIGDVWDITSQGKAARPMTLTIGYDESDLGSVNENSLAVFTYQNGWVPLPSSVDAAQNTVSASLSHFSLYALAPRPKMLNASRLIKPGETLKEVSNTTFNGREALRLKKMRKTRFLGIVPVDMEVEITVDRENESVVDEKKPWWGFLAFD